MKDLAIIVDAETVWMQFNNPSGKSYAMNLGLLAREMGLGQRTIAEWCKRIRGRVNGSIVHASITKNV